LFRELFSSGCVIGPLHAVRIEIARTRDVTKTVTHLPLLPSAVPLIETAGVTQVSGFAGRFFARKTTGFVSMNFIKHKICGPINQVGIK